MIHSGGLRRSYMSEVPKKRIKRALNRRFLTLVCVILIAVISIFKIPDFITTRHLEELGFSDQAVVAIKQKGLAKAIIDEGLYSEYLDSEIQKDDFKSDYLKLYVYKDALSDDDFLLYDRLIEKGYDEDTVINLYKELNFNELVALLVFDKLESTADYISDCIKNRTTNSDGALILNGDYLHPYSDVKEAPNKGSASVLVSQKYTLDNYIPQKLVPLTSQYASDGVQLENEAYGAFITMCDAMSEQDLHIYALSGYRSYDDQKAIYDAYASSEEADAQTTRPGHSEAQTGLSVIVVDSANESLANFINTPEYAYLKDNAHKFGFIIRYPQNKEAVTGYLATAYQLRYVGIDNATGIYESGLTWEEYYLLYLA